MNKVVRRHYPVSKLPEDLRDGFEGGRQVTITIEPDHHDNPSVEREPLSTASFGGDVTHFKQLRRANFKSSADVDAHVSALRDEWAHRDR